MKLLDMLLGRLSRWTADTPVVAKAPAKNRASSEEAKARRKAYKKRKAAKAARRRNRR